MRSILFTFAAALVWAAALTAAAPKEKDRPASVEQTQGIYLFIGCKPQDPYTTLGEIKGPGVIMNNEWKTTEKAMRKAGAKQYPRADAYICPDPEKQMEWTAVTFD